MKNNKNQESPRPNMQKKFKTLDIDTYESVQQLIKFANRLQPNPEQFKFVRRLFIRYGVSIMIHLKRFYSHINQQIKEKYSQQLQSLALIAFQSTDRTIIPQLQFIYQFLQDHNNNTYNRIVESSESQKKYNKFIAHLSKMNQRMTNNYSEQIEQQYRYLIEKQKSQKQYTKLMIRSINYYMLSEQAIKAIKQGGLKNQVRYIQESIQEQQEQQEQEQDQEIQQNNDFYSHQNDSKNVSTTIDSSFNCMSFSMEQQKTHLCCRRSFQQGQWIKYDQDIKTSFLSIIYPFSDESRVQIQRIICSFLNCEGGKFYLGIRKDQVGRKIVQKDLYTQNQKQQVLRQFRRIAQAIQNQLITQKMYQVEFVPIKDSTGSFIAGANVIRVTVSYGVRDQFYCYQQNGIAKFPFRSELDIFQKQGRQLLKLHKQIVMNPLPIPVMIHSEPCLKPQIGQQLHSRQKGITITNDKKFKKVNDKKMKQNEISNEVLEFGQQKNVLTDINKQQSSNTSKIVQISNQPQFLKDQSTCQQKMKYSYFYVIGVDQKHLIPVFEQKKLSKFVKIQALKQKRLILKASNEDSIDLTRRILKKIQTKYSDRNIKYHEMSLSIQVPNLQKNIQHLKKLNCKFKILQNNTIKFKQFGDSCQAFSILQGNKIAARFVSIKQ